MLIRRGMIAMLIAIATAAASLAGADAQASQASGARNDASVVCARRIDQMPASALRHCGYKVHLLRRVAALPAGGKAYDYGDYTLLVPPAHFDPLREPDRILAAYGFPTRKRLGKDFYRLMHSVRTFPKPPRYLVEDPTIQYNTDEYNWAGYDVNDHQYLSVETTWTEPHFVSHGCSGDQFAEWAGIGGIKSTDLGQEGTTFNHPGWPAHQGFIETISGGSGNPVEAAGFDPAAGDSVYALISWNSSTSEFDYYMSDTSNPNIPTYSANSRVVTANLDTAEVVSERPTVGTTGPPLHLPIYADLSDFQSLRVQYANGYWSTGQSGFYSDSHNSLTMVDSAGNLLADPGTLGTGSGFTPTYQNRCN